jgi:hypothetical protein
MANGKGDKQRVKWSKDYEEKFNKIFNKPKVKKEK